jgi:hypothetical protein
MKLILLLCCLICAFSFADEEPVMIAGKPEISVRTRRLANKYKNDISSGKLRKRTNEALDSMIRLAVYKLKRDGYKKRCR